MVNGALGLVWWLMGRWALSGGKWGMGCLFYLGCGPANDSTWEHGARVSYLHSLVITTPKPPLSQIQSLLTSPHIETPLCCCRCKLLVSAAVCRHLPLLPPTAWCLALLPPQHRLPLLLRPSLQPLPSPAAAAAADAFPLKASPHRSLRRRPGRRSNAIDAPPTP
jgi:hypothetical protein